MIVAINVAVVGAEFVVLADGLARSKAEDAREYAGSLVATIRGQIQPQGELNVERILRWPNWDQFTDAILTDDQVRPGPGGAPAPHGVALNPKGSLHRPADFDHRAVYGAIALVLRTGVPEDGVEGGRVVPIHHTGGTWGACWYRIDSRLGIGGVLARYFLPILLVSTVLLSGATFFALRRFVLDPVEQLAGAARRLAAGDLSARVPSSQGHDEVSELLRTFNAMSDQVQGFNERLAREVELATEHARRAEAAAMTQRRLAAMGELAAGIAHEINNPLGGLQNAVGVLSREGLPAEKRRAYLALLSGGLERIRLTVGRLLRLTPRQGPSAAVAIGQPLTDAVALVRHRAAQAGVRMELRVGGRSAPAAEPTAEVEGRLSAVGAVRGSGHDLAQVFLNLLVNALDALECAPRGEGRVEISVLELEGRVRVEVLDNGPGVAEEDLPRLVDLFYTTKEVGKGTGLGLSIVHNLVAGLGGSVELWSRPGAGFRAAVELQLDGTAQPG